MLICKPTPLVWYGMPTGNKLNPIQLKGIEGSDPKAIGAKLVEISEKARTHGQDMIIGSLYGFNLIVKTESSDKEAIRPDAK